tara:strand:- start:103 stop:303 length:201 start_codon:yes stop_codon:yes gene_type:complete
MEDRAAILLLILTLEMNDNIASDVDIERILDNVHNGIENISMRICTGGIQCVYEMTKEVYPEQILN